MVDDSLINGYIQESRDHLATIETDLLAIEAAGASIDVELVNKVFRAAHSIKGGAGFFSLTKIQKLAHRIENVLDLIRSKQMIPSPDIINILLLAFDRLREMINNHMQSEQVDIEGLVGTLTGLTSANLPDAEKGSLGNKIAIHPSKTKDAIIHVTEFDLNQVYKDNKHVYLVEFDLLHDIHNKGKIPWDTFKEFMSLGTILECAWDLDAVGTLDDDNTEKSIPFQILYATVVAQDMIDGVFDVPKECIHYIPKKQIASTPLLQPETTAAQTASLSSVKEHPQAQVQNATIALQNTPVENTLRVGVGLLDSLMNLAGEMVLSRNQLIEAIAHNDMRQIYATGQRISLVTTELQEAIMQTRMQPIGNVLSKFPRVVRDLSKEIGKEVTLETIGKDVELDKTIIEGLSDPLTHMVRNAVDHGIENPDTRVKAGKRQSGTITIKAYHEAGQVVIEIIDDGKGLDKNKIMEAAIKKGLLTSDKARTLSEKEKTCLIFLPGLSTAEKVTNVSGRGVGMDVVKTNIDKLGGTIDIETEIGKGSTFKIKLPLTLAIVPSLLVSVQDTYFAIPEVNVLELIRIPPAAVKDRIEIIGNAEVLILRGAMIPLIHLAHVLDIEKTFTDPLTNQIKPERRTMIADRRSLRHPSDNPGPISSMIFPEAPDTDFGSKRSGGDRRYHADSDKDIVVVTNGTFNYGIVVDKMHDTVEIVVKPLGRHLKGLREYAGATILGNGKLAIILDVNGIASLTGMTSLSNTSRAQELAVQSTMDNFTDIQSLLLFRNASHETCAVPLELVSRVERIVLKDIENVGGRRTMQYRNNSLPIVTLHDVAQVDEIGRDQELAVIVFEMADHEVGLLCAMPVDAIETAITIDQSTHQQKGISGSAIIKNTTTLIVDIFDIVESVHPEWTNHENAKVGQTQIPQGILLAEDSEFFRNQIKKFLESDGHTVYDAIDGQAAWDLLEKNYQNISAVVTDIEMPRLNGLGLTRKIKADPRFGHLPVVAVTSLSSEEDEAIGKAAGIDDYQVKFDKNKLLSSLRLMLRRSM